MTDNRSTGYNRTIDVIKGFLILLVIIGHVLDGTLDENGWRYLIYSFHMPLFFFVSGYLVNIGSIQNMDLCGVIKKYWKRMLMPWTVALIIYTGLSFWTKGFTFERLITVILFPYFHLWYIPCLFCMIMIVWGISKILGHSYNNIRYFAYIFIALLLYGVDILVKENVGLIFFRGSFFPFFCIGIMHDALPKMGGGKNTLRILFFICAIVICFISGLKYVVFSYTLLLPLNFYLISFIINNIIHKDKCRNKVFEFLGRNSLDFYLWHMLPIIIIKQIIHNNII